MIVDINRLPHLAPVRFVTEVLKAGEVDSASMVTFEEVPTLSAIVESAAQNVIFITSLYRDFEGGVLTGMKRVKLLKNLEKGSYQVQSILSARLDNFSMFKFTLLKDNEIFVEGEMSIVMNHRQEKLKKEEK